MEKVRQFLNPTGQVVTCHWDSTHGAWCCQCAQDNRFNLCADHLEPVYCDLREAGYEDAR